MHEWVCCSPHPWVWDGSKRESFRGQFASDLASVLQGRGQTSVRVCVSCMLSPQETATDHTAVRGTPGIPPPLCSLLLFISLPLAYRFPLSSLSSFLLHLLIQRLCFPFSSLSGSSIPSPSPLGVDARRRVGGSWGWQDETPPPPNLSIYLTICLLSLTNT